MTAAPNPDHATAVLDRLDQRIEAAYFTPLALGDALAVQFGVPALKGLPRETIAGVLRLIDSHRDAADRNPEAVRESFFRDLAERFPEVSRRWSEEEPGLVVDPDAALGMVLVNGEDEIRGWVQSHPDAEPDRLDDLGSAAARSIIDRVSPEQAPDDRALRRLVRNQFLDDVPQWLRPAVYLEVWTGYALMVLGRTPLDQMPPQWRSLWA